jgi:hypothetical protein
MHGLLLFARAVRQVLPNRLLSQAKAQEVFRRVFKEY